MEESIAFEDHHVRVFRYNSFLHSLTIRIYNGIDVPTLKYLSRMRERGDYVVVDSREALTENYHFSQEHEDDLLRFFSKQSEGMSIQQMYDNYCEINM